MKVLQVLPGLNTGGVERGTVDFASLLVREGAESYVMSSGGHMLELLESQGSQHIVFPVHEKSLKSLWRVRLLRRVLTELDVDVIHVRSRIPAWMVWLAVKKMPADRRPALVSTFHGLYSVSAYSKIMGCGDQVIAISECVRDYIINNYPSINPGKISVVHRGVDTAQFNCEQAADESWRRRFFGQYPQLADKPLVVMPGRLSRWKGQEQFIEMMRALKDKGTDCRGVIVGGCAPGKEAYLAELQAKVSACGLQDTVFFLGQRSDMAEIYSLASVVCNLSQHPEPFGRTVIEALAMGVPVVAFDEGGPAESLKNCLPQGLVAFNDSKALEETVQTFLRDTPSFSLPWEFTLEAQGKRTIEIYQQAIAVNQLPRQ